MPERAGMDRAMIDRALRNGAGWARAGVGCVLPDRAGPGRAVTARAAMGQGAGA